MRNVTHRTVHSPELTVTVHDQGARDQGKLYDVELHFTSGILAGLKLVGFAVWQLPGDTQSVTFPSRRYERQGETWSNALLRASDEESAFAMAESRARVTAAIAAAVTAYERTLPKPAAEPELSDLAF